MTDEDAKGLAALILLPIYIAWAIFVFWLSGSAVASGVKALTNNCHKTLPIERYVSANWFCPLEDKNAVHQ